MKCDEGKGDDGGVADTCLLALSDGEVWLTVIVVVTDTCFSLLSDGEVMSG